MELKFSESQEKEVINLICDCYSHSKDRFSEFYQLCQWLESFYEIKLPDNLAADLEDENPGLLPADIHIGVNEVIAQLYEILFGLDPWFKCVGAENTPELKLRQATEYLKKSTKKSKCKLSYVPTISSVFRFGMGVGYVDREKDEKKKKPGLSLLDFDVLSEERAFYPKYKPLNLRRFFPDPDNPKSNWAIYQSKISLLDLIREEDRYEQVDFDKIRKTAFPQGDWEEFFDSTNYRSGIMRNLNIPIELLHFRGWMPIPQEDSTEMPKFKDVIMTVANREVLIQSEENEWDYPAVDTFIRSFLFPEDADYIYPLGKIEASANAFLQKFYIRNRHLMAISRQLNAPLWTDDQSKEFPDHIDLKTGEIIKVSRGSKIEQMQIAPISKESMLEGNNLTNEIQYVIGSLQSASLVAPPADQKATGLVMLSNLTTSMRKFESRMIISTGLEQILQRYLDIGIELGAVNSVEDMEIEVQVNDVWNHPIQRQEMLQMMNIYKDDKYIDPVKLRRRHFRLLQFPEVEELVPDPAEKMLPVDKENMLMVQQGVFVPILPNEDHELHLKGHMQFKDHPIVAQHIQGHIAMLQGEEKSPNMRIPMAENEIGLAQQIASRLRPEMSTQE